MYSSHQEMMQFFDQEVKGNRTEGRVLLEQEYTMQLNQNGTVLWLQWSSELQNAGNLQLKTHASQI